MIKADERAPEFTLPDETGKDRSLTELLSVGAIVLYFYPADFTPGCRPQACVLRDLHSEIEAAGLRVVGISPQHPQTHAKFKAKYQLPFVLLSDQQKTVINVRCERTLGDRRAARHLFDRRRTPGARCGLGGFPDQPSRRFRAQGDHAARLDGPQRCHLTPAAPPVSNSNAIDWRLRYAAPKLCTWCRIPDRRFPEFSTCRSTLRRSAARCRCGR